MKWFHSIYLAIIFILCSPGIIFRFYPKNHIVSSVFHSILFALIFILVFILINNKENESFDPNRNRNGNNNPNGNRNNNPNMTTIKLNDILNKLIRIENRINVIDGKVNNVKSSLIA